MKSVSFFLHSLLFFYMFSLCPAFSQEYRRIDLERLLRNHPLMKQFDPKTARFVRSADERKDATQLQAELGVLERRIAEAESEKSRFVKTSLLNDSSSGNTEAAWEHLRNFDEKISLMQKEKAKMSDLLRTGGVPPLKTLYDDVKGLAADLFPRQQSGSGTILLNVFPRYPVKHPELPEMSLNDFFQTRNLSILRQHASFSCYTGLLFRATAEPILYIEGETGK